MARPASALSFRTLIREASTNSTRASVTSARLRAVDDWRWTSMTASGPCVDTNPSDDEGDRRADEEPLEASREQAPQQRTRGDHRDDTGVEPVFHLPELAALVDAPPADGRDRSAGQLVADGIEGDHPTGVLSEVGLAVGRQREL